MRAMTVAKILLRTAFFTRNIPENWVNYDRYQPKNKYFRGKIWQLVKVKLSPLQNMQLMTINDH